MSIYTLRNERDALGKDLRTFALCDMCGCKQETVDDFEMVRGVPPFGWGRKIVNNVMQFYCPKCAAQQGVQRTGLTCPSCKSDNCFEAVICVNCGAHSAPRR